MSPLSILKPQNSKAKSTARIYIVGGVTRSGKSLLARQLSEALGVPCFSLDYLTRGFVAAMPEIGFSDDNSDDDQALLMWPFLRRMIEAMLWDHQSYILEGSTILPHHLQELLGYYPGNVRVCCLGYANVKPFVMLQRIRQLSALGLPNDWMKYKPDEEAAAFIRDGIARSQFFAAECKRLELPYFDVSHDFMGIQQRALEYLSRRQAEAE